MSLSDRIIKGAEVQNSPLQLLPLRRCMTGRVPAIMPVNDNGSADNDDPIDIDADRAGLLALAEAQAEETINRARAAAEEVIGQARLESEEIKQEAYRSAFEQGSREGAEEGYREGMARAEEEAATIRAQASEVLEQAEKIRRRTLEAVEQEIVELAREIAEKLLEAQLTLAPETILNVAVESLRLVADRLNVVLYINPADLDRVKNRKDQLQNLLSARAELQIIADPVILPGGCRVETEQGRVDATIKTRWEELLKAL